jgi:Bacterial Ig-like domain (group 3)
MSRQRAAARSRMALCAVLAACVLGLLPASASAARSMSFEAAFSAHTHLGEGGSFSTELTFSGNEYHGQVAPLTGLTLHLPAGISLSSTGFPTCSKETIQDFGLYSGHCPVGSLAGLGSLSAVVWFPEPEEEQAEVQAVFGPGGVLYFVVNGHSPVSLENIMEAHLVSDSPPYGQELVVQVPVMEIDPFFPAVSITSLTLNLGVTWEVAGSEASSVTLPTDCSGSFAWGADAAFNGEASEPVGTRATACPPAGMRATTSTTLTVSSKVPKEEAPETYTVTVIPTSSGPAPSGTVTFYDGLFPISTCSAQPLIQGISSSTATCQVSYSDPFSHTIRAAYGGSEVYRGSLSHSETVVVDGTEETPAKEEAPAKHQEASVPNSSTQGTGGLGSTPNTGGVDTPVSASNAQIAALLGQQLIPSGKAAKIMALLKSDGLIMSVKALEAGTLVVGWYELPPGAKLATHSTAKPVLVASGQMTFSAAGTGRIKVKLTAVGKRLLKHAKRLRLTARAVFTPPGGAGVGTTKGFVVSY